MDNHDEYGLVDSIQDYDSFSGYLDNDSSFMRGPDELEELDGLHGLGALGDGTADIYGQTKASASILDPNRSEAG